MILPNNETLSYKVYSQEFGSEHGCIFKTFVGCCWYATLGMSTFSMSHSIHIPGILAVFVLRFVDNRVAQDNSQLFTKFILLIPPSRS